MTEAAAVAGRRTADRPAALGIDLGTSSVKAVMADVHGTVLADAVRAYPVMNDRPGWSETDPQEWMSATRAAVREVVARADREPAAIGFSGQMHGVVATDAEGQPLRPALLWSDARATPQLSLYRQLPADVRRRLANPLSPGMAGPMLAWILVNEPETYAGMRWALQPKDWLRAQITGSCVTEPSDASATLLYDLPADTWDDEVIGALGLDRHRLPAVLPASSAPAGQVNPSAAGVLGLPSGIPVAAGAADTAAAALGSGLVDPHTAQLTIGTGIQLVRPVTELPAEISADPVTHLYRDATDRGWYAMAAVLNGGSTLAWVRRTLAASWDELYAAASSEPHPDDPYFLPHLHGERTPYLDPDMRGAWTDLDPRHTREDLLRAALEGVAFAVCDALEAIVTSRDDAPLLRLAGGGTTHPAWRQMLSDVLGFSISAVDVVAASGLGAALLGARAAGLTDDAGLLGDRAPATRVVAEPRPLASALYRERYEGFRRRVAALRPSPGRGRYDLPTAHGDS